MSHKFKLRQIVRLIKPGFADKNASASATYEVIRLMPEDQSGEPAYRIKSRTGERAVRESELSSNG